MFDAVLHRGPVAPTRWSAGITLALFLHLAALVAAWRVSQRPQVVERQKVDITFVKSAPPPPPPPPPPKRTQTHKTIKHDIPKDIIVQPKEIPREKPPEEKPPEPEPEDDGVEGGVEGGVKGGVVGGVVGGVLGGQLGGVVGGQAPVRMEFNDKMTDPHKVSGPDPEYTQQAEDHQVEGLMLVKCVVTIDGRVHDCRVIKSLPFLDRSVVDALEKRRYTPALLDGKPVEVDYVFKIKMTLPE
jgi:protein TonB